MSDTKVEEMKSLLKIKQEPLEEDNSHTFDPSIVKTEPVDEEHDLSNYLQVEMQE